MVDGVAVEVFSLDGKRWDSNAALLEAWHSKNHLDPPPLKPGRRKKRDEPPVEFLNDESPHGQDSELVELGARDRG